MLKAARPKKTDKASKAIASTQSLSAFVKSICDVMRCSNCARGLQYVLEQTRFLFMRILDAQAALREVEALAAANAAQRAELERLPQRLLARAFEPQGTAARSLSHQI